MGTYIRMAPVRKGALNFRLNLGPYPKKNSGIFVKMVEYGNNIGALMGQRILIIEDDKHIAGLLRTHLEEAGYSTEFAFDGNVGLELALSGDFHLIVLDLKLPGPDGLEICRKIRGGQTDYTPILMLTSLSSELDRVLGLELGADDYMTKPFSVRELTARVKALFRRVEALKSDARTGPPKLIRIGDLTISTEKRRASIKDSALDLTAKEFDLLLQFALPLHALCV